MILLIAVLAHLTYDLLIHPKSTATSVIQKRVPYVTQHGSFSRVEDTSLKSLIHQVGALAEQVVLQATVLKVLAPELVQFLVGGREIREELGFVLRVHIHVFSEFTWQQQQQQQQTHF